MVSAQQQQPSFGVEVQMAQTQVQPQFLPQVDPALHAEFIHNANLSNSTRTISAMPLSQAGGACISPNLIRPTVNRILAQQCSVQPLAQQAGEPIQRKPLALPGPGMANWIQQQQVYNKKQTLVSATAAAAAALNMEEQHRSDPDPLGLDPVRMQKQPQNSPSLQTCFVSVSGLPQQQSAVAISQLPQVQAPSAERVNRAVVDAGSAPLRQPPVNEAAPANQPAQANRPAPVTVTLEDLVRKCFAPSQAAHTLSVLKAHKVLAVHLLQGLGFNNNSGTTVARQEAVVNELVRESESKEAMDHDCAEAVVNAICSLPSEQRAALTDEVVPPRAPEATSRLPAIVPLSSQQRDESVGSQHVVGDEYHDLD